MKQMKNLKVRKSKRVYSSNQKHRERKKELNKEKYNRQKASRTVERKNYTKYKNNLVFQKKKVKVQQN